MAIRADVPSLGHALWNLLDNAVKYSEGRGAIRVSARASEGGVAVLVNERQEIFGRFVHGSRARALGIPGTGLGLAMVSHIISAHGGTVRVDSEEERGSTFTIWLPCDANGTDEQRGQSLAPRDHDRWC